MKRMILTAAVVLALVAPIVSAEPGKRVPLALVAQSRDAKGKRILQPLAIDPAKTAVVVVDKRPHVVFVTAEKEYETHKTLPEFARRFLGDQYRCSFLNATADEGAGPDNIPGLEALYDADLLVLSVRRRALPVVQMDHLERYLRSSKPLVAIRVSAAAFAPSKAPRGHVIWERFDRDVLGCNYTGYNPKSRATGCDVWCVSDAAGHPILKDVTPARWHSASWIYRQRPLGDGTTVLLQGRWSQEDPEEPVAWVRSREGGRMFYTTLGHPEDFKQEPFNQLLLGAVRWARQRP